MLFDLRGRGRRRVVKVIYLSLAILMGGGLVFFGVGGNVSGGLFDAFRENSGNSATDQIEERRDDAAAATKKTPGNAAVWATLASAEYQLAGQSEGFNPNANTAADQFKGESRKHLEAAKAAWDRHIRLAGDNANAELAGTMKNALAALDDYEGAVRAQEIVLDGLDDPGFGDYAQLAALAYQAGQTRKGDLASAKAVELAPKDQKKDLKAQLDAQKASSTTGGAAATTPSG